MRYLIIGSSSVHIDETRAIMLCSMLGLEYKDILVDTENDRYPLHWITAEGAEGLEEHKVQEVFGKRFTIKQEKENK